MTFLFSVISPMFDVARYLPDYFECLESQSIGIENLEIILVDDGSTDDTLALAQAFAARHPRSVRVISKPNGGQASARNAGLEVATAEWVTFPDPDDVLAPDYFRDVRDLMRDPKAADAAMFTARMIMWYETGDGGDEDLRDTHALAARFAEGTRLVDLSVEPQIVQAHVTTGFLRRRVLADAGLRFREQLRLRFEDGNLVTRYLLAFDRPVVGIVATSHYRYRQRADASSTVQAGSADPRKYTDTIRYGMLDLVEPDRALPEWAQNLIVYDILWIFRTSQTNAIRRTSFPESMYDEVDELLPAILAHIDDDVIDRFEIMPVAPWMKDAMILVKHGGGHGPVHLTAIDPKRGLLCLVYRYRGTLPDERILVGGRQVEARFTKEWALEYLGRTVVHQRTLWIAIGDGATLLLDGVEQPVTMRENEEGVDSVTPALLRARSADAARLAEPASASPSLIRRLRRRVGITLREARAVWDERPGLRPGLGRLYVAWRAMSPFLARRFAGAWVFMDRDVDANDSAEVLYRWMVRTHPEINSWFVLRRGTRDWDRLEKEGARLVDYGSAEFAALMLSAEHVASSHADRFVSDPIPPRLGRRAWNFTFLQHGVIKGDISMWLNPKAIATFVTSTQDEYDYIVGPSTFRFGMKEVRLTGLPRFDALQEQDAAVPDAQRDLVLVMPTWRDYLVGAMVGDTSRDREVLEHFHETAYARGIRDLLGDPVLHDHVQRAGARLVFMPHPNMLAYLDRFELPDVVEVLGYDDADVRELIARARLLVTDYSSVAFNMAYVQRPVVYYQFDRDEYFRAHTERPAYFDYETHGFGRVTVTAEEAVAAVAEALEGRTPAEYGARMASTFPVRDGQNSRRVYEAMVAARSMRSLEDRSRAASPDRWDPPAG